MNERRSSVLTAGGAPVHRVHPKGQEDRPQREADTVLIEQYQLLARHMHRTAVIQLEGSMYGWGCTCGKNGKTVDAGRAGAEHVAVQHVLDEAQKLYEGGAE